MCCRTGIVLRISKCGRYSFRDTCIQLEWPWKSLQSSAVVPIGHDNEKIRSVKRCTRDNSKNVINVAKISAVGLVDTRPIPNSAIIARAVAYRLSIRRHSGVVYTLVCRKARVNPFHSSAVVLCRIRMMHKMEQRAVPACWVHWVDCSHAVHSVLCNCGSHPAD